MRFKVLILLFVLFKAIFPQGTEAQNLKIDSLKMALDEVRGKPDQIRILNQLGYEYWIVNPVHSVIYGQRALQIAENINDSMGIAYANRVIGVAWWARGGYDEALEYLFRSLQLNESIGDSLEMANVLMNIGLVYSDRKAFNQSRDYYYRAMAYFEQLDRQGRLATTYTKIATDFIETGKLDSAEYYLEQSLKIHRKNKFDYGISEALNRYGLLFLERDDLENSEKAFKQSIRISKRITDREGLAKNYENLANVYFRKGYYLEAEEILLKGIEIAKEIGSIKWLKDMYGDLRTIYQSLGNYERAIFYYDQYIRASDSLYNEQMINHLIQLESQIANAENQRLIAERDREIRVLEQKSLVNRIFLISSLIILILLILIGYLVITYLRTKNRRKEEIDRLEREKLKRDIELKDKELASYALNFAQKNQLFETVAEEIDQVKKKAEPAMIRQLNELQKTISSHAEVDRDWEDFNIRFQNIHEGFFDKLNEICPSLTPNELRLAALVKLNFSMKEIGNILKISADSVKTARYRLKKKLGIGPEETLNEFFNTLS